MADSLRDRVRRQKQTATTPQTFIEGADVDTTTDRPWEQFNKRDVPRTTFNLRLNDYELTLLRWLAKQRDESMQRVAKRALIPLLEQLAREATEQTN